MTGLPRSSRILADQPADDTSNGLVRLAGLTDAVIAFALTLLVLDLRPPDNQSGPLADILLWLWPKLLIYLVVFGSVANYWNIHQRVLAHLARGDQRFVLFSLVALLFITLVPASTVIVGRYPSDPLALACYSGNWALLSLATWAMWRYAGATSSLLRAGANPDSITHTGLVWLGIAIANLLAVILAFASIYVAYAVWIGSPFVLSVWWHRRIRAAQVSAPAGLPKPQKAHR